MTRWRSGWNRVARPWRARATADRAPAPGTLRASLLALLALVVVLLLTGAGLWWQSRNLEALTQARFNQGADRTRAEIVRRLNLASYGLKGARGLYAAQPEVGRLAFRAFVQSRDLATEFPGVRGFGFIEHVQRKDLPAFLARTRADHAPDFAVQTSGSAPDLFIVKYVEPEAANAAALGLDEGVGLDRRQGMEYAMNTGESTLMGPITLYRDGKSLPGFLYLLPIYRQGSTAHDVATRQKDLVGILYAPIVSAEMLGSVAQISDGLLDFALFDGDQPDRARLIYDADGSVSLNQANPGQAEEGKRRYVDQQVFTVGSHVLTLRISGSPAFDATRDVSSIYILGAGGTLLSVLMATAVWLLAAGRQRAQALARHMTSELNRMAQVVQHTDNAVTIMDSEMRIQWVNRGFTQITGYTLDEAKGRRPGDLLTSGRSDPAAVATLIEGAKNGLPCRVELINRAKDGTEYWADTEVQPQRGAQGQLLGFMEIGTDISERKRAQQRLEAALRESRALLNTVEVHAIVSTTDPSGCILDVNDAFCRISGYSREELIGHNHRLVNSGRHDQAFWEDFWATICSGQPWRGEICNLAKDGTPYWVDSMIAPFVGENGVIEKYVSIRTDITARHQTLERLRRSEATFAAAFQHAASGIAFVSARGQWLQANPALCDYLGYDEASLQELTLSDVSPPDEWDIDRQQMQRLLDGEMPVYQRAKRYLHSDGHVLWGLASVSAVRAEDASVQFLIVQIVDITARKRAEEALSVSNALLEESQQVARVGGWELDLRDKSLYWTRETYRIHDTSPDEYTPQIDTAAAFFLPDSRERLFLATRKAVKDGEPFDLELDLQTASGRQITVRTTATATRENARTLRLSGIVQDVTEARQYERSLREAREKAEQATQSKGQFLANMSHEIRTPMNAILGMLKLLHNTELSNRQRDYTEKTEGAARSLLGLINDILDYSKVEAGKMTLDPQAFRVDQLMRNLAVILSSNVGPKAVQVLFDIDAALPPVLLGDAMRLQQILINLGGNAVKFTLQGEVVVAVRCESQDAHSARVTFAVRDSGIGIAPENQARIFTGFSQAEASTTRKFGGTGLGLAISRRFVEMMGGTLALESTLGQGSTFYFTLDLPLVDPVPPELQDAPRPTVKAQRVLVIDGNAVARALHARFVQSWGWPVDAVENAEVALELVQARTQAGEFPFDVVYVDWRLSGMDGWACAAQLRQRCSALGAPQPVIVMVSANGRETLEQRTRQEQELLNGFLVKPVTASMLLDAALEASSSPARLRQSVRPSKVGQRRLVGMQLLVVEDNLINQQVAEELLMAEGARVSLAANGQLGVDAIASAEASGRQFDAVLMDIQMPVLDGIAATRQVREKLHLTQLPIIAMTANAQASDQEECIAAGMNDHVGKPFDLNHLVNTLLRCSGYTPYTPAEQPGAALASTDAAPEVPAAPDSVDVRGALARMGGLQSLYARALRDFMRELPGQLDAIVELQSGDLAQMALLAHTLKGTSALLGAMALSRQASALEQRVKGGRKPLPQELEQGVTALLDEAARSGAALQTVLASLPPGEATPPRPAGNALAPGQREAAQQALQRLLPQLAASDLGALAQFAQDRDVLALFPEELMAGLEGALQSLDLAHGLQLGQRMQDWLAAGA